MVEEGAKRKKAQKKKTSTSEKRVSEKNNGDEENRGSVEQGRRGKECMASKEMFSRVIRERKGETPAKGTLRCHKISRTGGRKKWPPLLRLMLAGNDEAVYGKKPVRGEEECPAV